MNTDEDTSIPDIERVNDDRIVNASCYASLSGGTAAASQFVISTLLLNFNE